MNNEFSSGEYLLTLSFEDELKKFRECRKLCSLCKTYKKKFYCKYCVQDGDFSRSQTKKKKKKEAELYLYNSANSEEIKTRGLPTERFINKKLRRDDILRAKIKLLVGIEEKVCENSKLQKLNDDIVLLESRVNNLKCLETEKCEKLIQGREKLDAVKKEVMQYESKCEQYKVKINKTRTYINKFSSYVSKRNEQLESYTKNIVKLKKLHVSHLFTYILPIHISHEDVATSVGADAFSEDDMASELAEASRMEYVDGQWRCREVSDEVPGGGDVRSAVEYGIVSAGITLPTDGNYSAYHYAGTAGDEPMASRSHLGVKRREQKMNAALVYTTQLVNLLAFFLDVSLPKQLCYSTFSCGSLEQKSLNKAIQKLHRNVIYLCLSQGMASKALQSKHILQNLSQLPHAAHLGQCPYYELDDDLLQSIEDTYDMIGSDGYPEQNSSDEESDLLKEWESVANLPYTELQLPVAPTGTLSSRIASHYSSAGGFFNAFGLSYFTRTTYPPGGSSSGGSSGGGSGSGERKGS